MSKSKKRKNVCQGTACGDTEGKYQKLCQEYRERDELEALNRRVDERHARMEQFLWEQEAKAEKHRIEDERRFNGILKLIGVIILCATIAMALSVLAVTEIFSWWISGAGIVIAGFIASFKAGYLWHEIKK